MALIPFRSLAHLPPGPRDRLRSTYQLLRRPLEVLPRWSKEFGDPFMVCAVNGNVVTTGDPELAKTVFSAPPDTFEPFGTKALECMLGPDSLFLLSGERHQRERHLLMPAFGRHRMKAYAPTIADAALHHMQRAEGGAVFRIQDVCQSISLEVILRSVFGVRDRQRIDTFADAVLDMLDAVNPMILFMPFLQRPFGGIGPFANFRRRSAKLDELLRDQIRHARSEQEESNDILSALAGAQYEDGSKMAESSILDQLRTLLLAGHDSTALGLSWTLDAVHRHPRVLAKVQEEIGTVDMADAARYAALPYLDAVCREALRRHPIVTDVFRTLRKPLQLGQYKLPRGITLAINAHLVHGRPELYPDPMAFRPERFLERAFSPFEFMPFGGGHRRCVGGAFAMFEMKVVLGTLLRRYDFKLQNKTPPQPVRRNITLEPNDGVPTSARQRQTG